MSFVPIPAPRVHTVSLPPETFPFEISPILSRKTSLTLDFSTIPIHTQNLSSSDASRPATTPDTRELRIVHPSLTETISVIPSSPSSAFITVSDVLTAIHAALSRSIREREVPSHRRPDVLSYWQSTQSKQTGHSGPAVLRVVDLLEGACIFHGLEMDIATSNRLMGRIDRLQTLTWILVTRERNREGISPYSSPLPTSPPLMGQLSPPLGLGPTAAYMYMPAAGGPQHQQAYQTAVYPPFLGGPRCY